jgi:amidase
VGLELDRAGAEPSQERLEAVSRTALREARAMTGVQAAAGFTEFDVVLRAVCEYFRDYDLLVTPTLGRPAPPHGTLAYDDERHTMESWLASIFEIGPFTAVFNISGHPAISLPLAQTADHVPLGVQVVARYGREDLLFRVAAQLEQAMPWAGRRPPVDAGALG